MSRLSPAGTVVNSPADVAYETMKLDMRLDEVDPIHRRIVLAGEIPEDQPPRPETPSKIIPMESEHDMGYPPLKCRRFRKNRSLQEGERGVHQRGRPFFTAVMGG